MTQSAPQSTHQADKNHSPKPYGHRDMRPRRYPPRRPPVDHTIRAGQVRVIDSGPMKGSRLIREVGLDWVAIAHKGRVVYIPKAFVCPPEPEYDNHRDNYHDDSWTDAA